MDRRSSIDQVRILFALAGLHRVDRGAEVAFISVARELVKLGQRGDADRIGPAAARRTISIHPDAGNLTQEVRAVAERSHASQ